MGWDVLQIGYSVTTKEGFSWGKRKETHFWLVYNFALVFFDSFKCQMKGLVTCHMWL